MNAYQFNIYEKTFIFWAIFLALYFVYKYFPNRVFAIFCGTVESNFQHYKAAFYSWIFSSALEFAFFHAQIADGEAWFYSRLGMAILLPWFVFLLWYLCAALYGKLPTIPLEIIYANLITIIAGAFGAVFERGLAQIEYSAELKFVLWALCFASIALYLIFTFVKLPWADVFVEPDWKDRA